jgi:mono/diheme cytochrome c family protein
MKTVDEKFKRSLQLVLVLAFVGVILPGFGRPQTATTVEHQSPSLIRSVEGPDLFQAYCTSCHGLDARGAGPAAAALKAKVPDLTLLARNNRGQFPAARVRQMIMGDKVVAAHGREKCQFGTHLSSGRGGWDWGRVVQ